MYIVYMMLLAVLFGLPVVTVCWSAIIVICCGCFYDVSCVGY
jgi:hypothetical protein